MKVFLTSDYVTKWDFLKALQSKFRRYFAVSRHGGSEWAMQKTAVGVGQWYIGQTSLISLLTLCLDAFEIRRLSSVFLRVRTNVGVKVLYDREGLRLYLQVDQRWVEDTVGLCGTFNGNTQDDFLYVPLS